MPGVEGRLIPVEDLGGREGPGRGRRRAVDRVEVDQLGPQGGLAGEIRQRAGDRRPTLERQVANAQKVGVDQAGHPSTPLGLAQEGLRHPEVARLAGEPRGRAGASDVRVVQALADEVGVVVGLEEGQVFDLQVVGDRAGDSVILDHRIKRPAEHRGRDPGVLRPEGDQARALLVHHGADDPLDRHRVVADMPARPEDRPIPTPGPFEVPLYFEPAPFQPGQADHPPDDVDHGQLRRQIHRPRRNVERPGSLGPLPPEFERLAIPRQPALADGSGRLPVVADLGGLVDEPLGRQSIEDIRILIVGDRRLRESVDVERVADIRQAAQRRHPPGQERRRTGQDQGSRDQDDPTDRSAFRLGTQGLVLGCSGHSISS